MSSATIVLKVFAGAELITTHRVSRELVKIGRLETSHVRLDDDSIARMHAVLEVGERELRVVDLGSSVGTLVNGVPVERSAAVRAGDRIDLGRYTMLVDVERRPAFAPVVPSSTAIAARPVPGPSLSLPEVELESAAPVAEVIGTWHGRVRDVQHVGQAPVRRTDASAWIALGALLVVGGAVALAHDVTEDWSAYREQARVAADHGQPVPAEPGWGLGGFGLGLVVLGLVPLTFGVTRRRDRVRSSYVLGESSDASFPLAANALAGASEFTLVRRDDSGITLRYTEGMRGELRLEHRSLDLREANRAGLARVVDGAYELPLTAGAHAQIGIGEHTFHVRSVAPGRAVAGRGEADRPYWIANGGAAAAIGSLLVLTAMIPSDVGQFTLDESLADNRFVGYLHQPDGEPETVVPEQEAGEQQGGTPGTRAEGHEGKMGKPSAKQANRRYAMRGPRDAAKQLARDYDPTQQASTVGLLGLIRQDQGHFLSSPNAAAFAVGNDDEDVWGNMTGTEIGEAYGVGGLGLVGSGRGGGGQGEGTLGLGNVGTIGDFGKNGRGGGYRHGDGGGPTFDGRRKRVPQVRIAGPTVGLGVDKEIIRRVIRSHLMEVRGCYNQGLVGNPNLSGRVAIQFTIGPGGTVGAAAVAESSVDDTRVGNCIAKAVRRWKFPKPTNGGSTLVSYPFVLDTR